MPESEEDRDAPGLQLEVPLEVDPLDRKRRAVKSNDCAREAGENPPDRQRAAAPGARGAAKPPARKCTPTFS